MKKYRLFLFLLAILVAVSSSGCIRGIKGNGDVVSQEISERGFNSILVNGVANMNIHSSDTYRVVVTIDSNLQDIVETSVSNNVLEVTEKSNTGFNPTKFIIDVYMPEVTNITLNGAGEIKVVDGKTSSLKLTLNGAGKIDAQDYEVQNVNVSLNGAGQVTAWATSALDYQISGVGSINYRGSPAINGSKSGLGTIRQL